MKLWGVSALGPSGEQKVDRKPHTHGERQRGQQIEQQFGSHRPQLPSRRGPSANDRRDIEVPERELIGPYWTLLDFIGLGDGTGTCILLDDGATELTLTASQSPGASWPTKAMRSMLVAPGVPSGTPATMIKIGRAHV